jgi:trigger factor
MESKLTSKTDTQAVLTISVNDKLLNEIKKHVFDAHLRPKVKAAGFRPGKAPDAIVERQLGSNAVQNDVLDEVLQETYSRAIREHELSVVASPDVKVEKFVPYTELTYTAMVELMAPIVLGDYKSVRVKQPEIAITLEEIDRTLEDLRRREAARVESTEPAEQTDELLFDFHGTKDGADVPGARADGQTLQLGSNTFIPGFEDELIGMKAGEDKTFDITFPKEYHEKTLAGEVVTFAVHIKTVTKLALPEVNEEFIAKVSPFKTEAELREDITQKLSGQKEQQAARQYEQDVIDAVVKQATYTAPESLISQQLTRTKAELEQNLAYSGLDMEKYLQMSGKTMAEIDNELRPEAERRVALALVLTEVAKAEAISVTDEDLDDEIGRMKLEYPDPQTQAELNNPNTREELYNRLMASHVIARLVGYAETPVKK